MDRLGYDGVGFNEHHTSPYGLMNSPNLLAAAAAQRTQRLKLLMYGNLLPLHDPLRLAEELAMLDCMSNGRIVSGFARGIPREHNVYNVPLADSRARFEEAWEIIRRAWTEEVFSYEGRFWSYRDVAIWPRPVQQPHPPVWVPVTGSKETIEWAGRHNIPITPGLAPIRGLREDIIGTTPMPRRARSSAHAGPSRSSRRARTSPTARPRRCARPGPYLLYFNQTLFSHGNITESRAPARRRLPELGVVRLRAPGEPACRVRLARALSRHDHGRRSSATPSSGRGGRPDEVIEKIVAAADHAGAATVLVNMNRGAMPQEMFLEQVHRFGSKVLPALAGPRRRGAMIGRRVAAVLAACVV